MACTVTLKEDEKKLVCMFETCFSTNKPDHSAAATLKVISRAELNVHEQNEVEPFSVIGGVLYVVKRIIPSLC